MLETNLMSPPARIHFGAPRPQWTAKSHLGSLEDQLSITNAQSAAWLRFADTVRANTDRTERVRHRPFGVREERLAALSSMRAAATELFAVLDTKQRHTALQCLPLCCLPGSC
jgi:hypothetical protein